MCNKTHQKSNRMKRRITSLLVFFIICNLYSQDWKQSLAGDLCTCIEENEVLTADTFGICFNQLSAKYKTELEPIIPKNVNSSDKSEIREFQLFFLSIQKEVINNCTVWFEYSYDEFNNEREKQLTSLKESLPLSLIDSLDMKISKDSSSSKLLTLRGDIYFVNDYYSRAIIDYEAALDSNKNDIKTLMFLAWSYEKSENYSKALEYYELFMEKSNNPEIALLIEYVRKKSQG